MSKYTNLRSAKTIAKAAQALQANGITVTVVNTKEEATNKVLELVPEGAEVMTMTSTTLEQIGLAAIINESGKYNSVRKQLDSMDKQTQGNQMHKLRAAPEYAIGSVHGITVDGELIIVSESGSQLPAYAHGASHVIWVAGSQKIADSYSAAMKRIEEYVLPKESERAQKAYGSQGSGINKILTIRKETNPNRLHLIIVRELLGF